jgi:hypothetical protein
MIWLLTKQENRRGYLRFSECLASCRQIKTAGIAPAVKVTQLMKILVVNRRNTTRRHCTTGHKSSNQKIRATHFDIPHVDSVSHRFTGRQELPTAQFPMVHMGEACARLIDYQFSLLWRS